MTKKKWVFSILLAIFAISIFTVYMRMYQQVVNDGTLLAEEHCLTVNPAIAYKQQKALEYMNAYQSSSSADIQQSSTDFSNAAQQVVDLYVPFLGKQKAFLNRWDFQFFTSKELKDVYSAQYHKYLTDMESNKLIVSYFKNYEDPTVTKQLQAFIEKQLQAEATLNDKLKVAKSRFDIRWYFTQVPNIHCEKTFNNF